MTERERRIAESVDRTVKCRRAARLVEEAAPDLLAAALALLEFWDNGTSVHLGAEVVADLRIA